MSWQVLIAISLLFEAFGRIMQRIIMRERGSDPVAPAIFYQLFAAVLFTTFSLFAGYELPNLQPLIPLLILSPLLWSITNILIFRSLKTTEASVFTILFASRTLFIILLSLQFLDETFSLKQGIGALLILLAVVLVSWKPGVFKFHKGELLALVAAVVIAVALVIDNYIVRTIPTVPYLAYNFFLSGMLIWIFHFKSTKHIIALGRNTVVLKEVLLLGFLFAVSAGAALLAYQVGRNAAQLGAIFPVSNILIVLLAIVILKERSRLVVKILASILCFVGILLVA